MFIQLQGTRFNSGVLASVNARREVTMHRASLALSILSILFIFVAAPADVNAQQNSQGVFSESGYDFKGIPRYTRPRHSFIFTNNGKDDLTLITARASCQCTKVFIPKKRVFKPGEKGEVVAEIDGVRFTGARHVTVTVIFQRGSSVFEIPLKVTGVIIDNVSIQPQKLTFLLDQEIKPSGSKRSDDPLQLSTNQSSRSQQTNVVYPGYNETVSRYASSSPYLDVRIGKPSRAPNGGYQTPVNVSVKNDAPPGYIDATVQLWSNGPSGSTPLVLSVTGVVRAPLTVSPGTLTFFTSEHGEKITKNFVVSAPTEFTLKSVQSPSKAIECNFSQEASRPSKVYVVPVTFDPSMLSDSDKNPKLKIETADGRVLFLTVQISSGNFTKEVVDADNATQRVKLQAKLRVSNGSESNKDD